MPYRLISSRLSSGKPSDRLRRIGTVVLLVGAVGSGVLPDWSPSNGRHDVRPRVATLRARTRARTGNDDGTLGRASDENREVVRAAGSAGSPHRCVCGPPVPVLLPRGLGSSTRRSERPDGTLLLTEFADGPPARDGSVPSRPRVNACDYRYSLNPAGMGTCIGAGCICPGLVAMSQCSWI